MTLSDELVRCQAWITAPPRACPGIRYRPSACEIVWELDDGGPRYQVPRFQMMAATRRANTTAKPERPDNSTSPTT